MSIDWQEWKSAATDGEFPDKFTFDEKGAELVGAITNMRVADFGQGDRKPELWIKDDAGKEWAIIAGQVQLRAKLAELEPTVGDRVKIVFTDIEPRPGGKTLKLFDVALKKAEPATTAAEDF